MFKVGQRQVTAFVFIALTVAAALLGTTPESLADLVTGLLVPLGTVAGIAYYLFLTIQKRVMDPNDKLEAGDIFGLLGSTEFVTAVVTAIIALLPRFGLVVGDEVKGLIITLTINFAGLISILLNRSFTQRLSRQSA